MSDFAASVRAEQIAGGAVLNEELAFLTGIATHPADDLRRLVYADWLDERGDMDSGRKAEYLRWEVHVHTLPDDHPERGGVVLKLRDLAGVLPYQWKAAVAKVDIENCNVRWRFQCPKRWDQLEPTRLPEVRFCSACRKDVFFCDSVELARRLGEERGHCVALDLVAARAAGDMDLLRPPAELEGEIEMGDIAPDDFNAGAPGEGVVPPVDPRPLLDPQRLLRFLWRKLRGK